MALNLLVVLCADREAQPVAHAGSLYEATRIRRTGELMPSPGKKAFPLRLIPRSTPRLSVLPRKNWRSVNAELEFLLRESLKKRGVKMDDVTKPAEAPTDDAT